MYRKKSPQSSSSLSLSYWWCIPGQISVPEVQSRLGSAAQRSQFLFISPARPARGPLKCLCSTADITIATRIISFISNLPTSSSCGYIYINCVFSFCSCVEFPSNGRRSIVTDKEGTGAHLRLRVCIGMGMIAQKCWLLRSL